LAGNEVFNVTSFNTTNSDVLTIVGDGTHNVVLNFNGLSANFNNQVKLVGISSEQVLYNFVGDEQSISALFKRTLLRFILLTRRIVFADAKGNGRSNQDHRSRAPEL
jgi:hypothetical protein